MRHRFGQTLNYICNETRSNVITIGRIFVTTTINGAYNLFLVIGGKNIER